MHPLHRSLSFSTGFVNRILYTDEYTFTRDGIFNSKNWHRFSLNLWCSVVGNYLASFKFITLKKIKVWLMESLWYKNIIRSIIRSIRIVNLFKLCFLKTWIIRGCKRLSWSNLSKFIDWNIWTVRPISCEISWSKNLGLLHTGFYWRKGVQNSTSYYTRTSEPSKRSFCANYSRNASKI